MGTKILEKAAKSVKSSEICQIISESTNIRMVGGGAASVKLDGILVATLTVADPIYEVTTFGEYCIKISEQCPYTAIFLDTLFTQNIPDTEVCAPIVVTKLVDPLGTPGQTIDGGRFVQLLRQKTGDGLFYQTFAKVSDGGVYTTLDEVQETPPLELNSLATNINDLLVYGIHQNGTTDHRLFTWDIVANTRIPPLPDPLPLLSGAPAIAFKGAGFNPVTNQYIPVTAGPSGVAYVVDTDLLTFTQIAGKVLAGGAGNRDISFGLDGTAYWTTDNQVYRDTDFFNPASTGAFWVTVPDPSPTQSGGSLGFKNGNVEFIGSDKSISLIDQTTGVVTNTGNTLTDADATPLNLELAADLAEGIDTVILPDTIPYTRLRQVCCDGIVDCYLDADEKSVEPAEDVIARLTVANGGGDIPNSTATPFTFPPFTVNSLTVSNEGTDPVIIHTPLGDVTLHVQGSRTFESGADTKINLDEYTVTTGANSNADWIVD